MKFIPEDPSVLRVPGLRDRGLVYVDNEMVGIVSRREKVFTLSLSGVRLHQVITIVVENQGRINFGWEIHDPKVIFYKERLETRGKRTYIRLN